MLNTALEACQYVGVFLSMVGAPLVASREAAHRRLGYGIWLVSNVFLIAWACSIYAYGLIAMQTYFTATSIKGFRVNKETPLCQN